MTSTDPPAAGNGDEDRRTGSITPRDEPGDRIGQLRGAGVSVDARRVGQVAIGIVLVTLAVAGDRLHDCRDPHEPAGRPPPPRRRAGHVHGDGMPRPSRRQRQQRRGVLVSWHLHPRREALLRTAAPGRLVPPARLHSGGHRRAGRSRPGLTGVHRRHRTLVGRCVRVAGWSWRRFCSCSWRCSCCSAAGVGSQVRLRKAACSACCGGGAARQRSDSPWVVARRARPPLPA